MEDKKKSVWPFTETDEKAGRRAKDLPDQPQAHINRGYGAVNPSEIETETPSED